MNNNEVITTLNNLIETCRRGQNGFRNAADSIQNSEFRRLFNIFSQQRAQFATELKSEVHRLGGDTNKGSDTVAEAKKTVPFKSSRAVKVNVRDEATVMNECQREEETAVNDYQEALKADLPLDVQYV